MKKILCAAAMLAAFSSNNLMALSLFAPKCDAKLVEKAKADHRAGKHSSSDFKAFKVCVNEGYVVDLKANKPIRNKPFYDAATEAFRETAGLAESMSKK